MKRRQFITLLGGAAAWPIAARAQQVGRVRRIGVLMNAHEADPVQQPYVTAFEQVLRGLGWRRGQNLEIDYRWTEDDPGRTRAQAAELVASGPEVIVASTTGALTAAQAATRTIPIVFANVSDPVAQGFASSLAHPGGNITGFSAFEFSIGGKWLGLLKEVSPALARAGLMFNPASSPQSRFFLASVEAAAPSFGVRAIALPVQASTDIEPAIATLAGEPNGGLIIGTDNFLNFNREQVAALAIRHHLPTIFASSDFVTAGGLMSYGFDAFENYRGAAFYVDRILKGEKPGDLPIQLATKFTLKINLKTVQALGLDLPMGLMLRVDEVIE
jgi:putative ABC transport system substrate-binding protein